MARDIEFTVFLPDHPESLAELAEILGNAAVNIEGLQGAPYEGRWVMQLVTENAEHTINVLNNAGVIFTAKEVLKLNLAHRPGSLALVARAMAEKQIRIAAVFITMQSQVMLDVDNLVEAEAIVSNLNLV
jgi:hypothetical protein